MLTDSCLLPTGSVSCETDDSAMHSLSVVLNIVVHVSHQSLTKMLKKTLNWITFIKTQYNKSVQVFLFWVFRKALINEMYLHVAVISDRHVNIDMTPSKSKTCHKVFISLVTNRQIQVLYVSIISFFYGAVKRPTSVLLLYMWLWIVMNVYVLFYCGRCLRFDILLTRFNLQQCIIF